jgi:hypothetical protein
LLLRLLFLFLIAYVLFSAMKAYITGRKSGGLKRKSFSVTDEEEMVLDPQCQSYLPKSEAILQQGEYFCSRECAKRYLSR